MQALAPRRLPSSAAIEVELQRLRLEDGGAGSDDETGNTSHHVTALAKEPSDYFGFVG